MYWRLLAKQYEQQKGAQNRESFKKLVQQEKPLGIIALHNEVAIGWCSISPKPSLVRLSRSRLFKNLKNIEHTWSITCLFVRKEYRNQGLSVKLISAACDYVFKKGAIRVESYPILPRKKHMPAVFAYVGFESSFRKAGFKEVVQVSPGRMVMRRSR